jgi:hypothetical protein
MIFGLSKSGWSRLFKISVFLAVAGCLAQGPALANKAAEGNRCAFVAITNLAAFAKAGTVTNESVWLSPEITAPIPWNELIVSWNALPGTHLTVEARALYADHATKYFTLGMWSDDPAQFPRQSLRGQEDNDGTVKQDTLVLSNTVRRVQLRLTGGPGDLEKSLKFLSLSFCNSTVTPAAKEPNRAAWGKTLAVPERRQGEYEGGGGWCSPTSLSMDLAYWGDLLHRPELNHTVPETAAAISDGARGETGNWPFNTAYAGRHPGVRAYVTRMEDISELEDWIAAGIPVIISVSSYLASDRTSGPDNGHLIVCVGFTDKGDVVVNDPGASVKRNVRPRRVFAREKVVKAWNKSKFAAYLIYPENAKIPANRFGHWADSTAVLSN